MSNRLPFHPLRALFLGAIWLLCTSTSQAQSPQELVESADKVRNPAQPFRVQTKLMEYRNGQPHDSATLVLYSKLSSETGQYRNLARYVNPAADAGKALLMRDKIMWFFDPSSGASVRISPQQRLVGQASNGDVVTVNFARDYKASRAIEETIKDADNKERAVWRLDLDAANESAVYLRIEYWVEKQTAFPVKARFYADSGRALKVAYYRKFSQQLGSMRPTEVVILDEIDTAVVTKMAFSDYRAIDIPENWFQRDYLPHLRSEP